MTGHRRPSSTIEVDAEVEEGALRLSRDRSTTTRLDLDTAIGRRAEELARLGSEESRDVRRARAAGELARADQTLDYDTGGEDGLVTGRRRPSSTTEDPDDSEGGLVTGRRRPSSTTESAAGSSSSPRRGTSRGRIETPHTEAPAAFRRRPRPQGRAPRPPHRHRHRRGLDKLDQRGGARPTGRP